MKKKFWNLTITSDKNEQGLLKFYENVARELGYTEEQISNPNILYDCREINVAKNIQDKWFDYYEKEYNAQPYEVAMLLLQNGAKVDEKLKENKVVVFDGFVLLN